MNKAFNKILGKEMPEALTEMSVARLFAELLEEARELRKNIKGMDVTAEVSEWARHVMEDLEEPDAISFLDRRIRELERPDPL